MTISSLENKSPLYSGPGSGPFSFSMKVFSKNDLHVVRADSLGAETVLVVDSDYTASINADQDVSPGGSITLAVALGASDTLIVARQVDAYQGVDLINAGPFHASVIENALDKLTILHQQNEDEVSRSMKLAITTPAGVDANLPQPVPYALIGWNGSGDGFQNTDPTYSSALATDLAASGGSGLVGHISPGATTERTVQSKLREQVSVKDFGAVGNGTADDTAAIQAAIDYMESIGGGTLWIPLGFYKTTSTLSISNGGLRLIGEGVGRVSDPICSIQYYGTGNALEIIANAVDGFGLVVSSFSIEDKSGTGNAAIYLKEFTFGNEINHVHTKGFAYGVYSAGGNFRSLIRETRHTGARTWGICLERIGGVGAVRSNNFLIEKVLIDGQKGIYLNDTINVTISNCDMESIAYAMDKAILCNNTQNTVIRENYIELNYAATNGIIELANGNSAPLIIGNLISNINVTSTCLYMSNCSQVTVMNNLFTAGATSTTTAIHGASANVVNCVLINNRYTPAMTTNVDWTGGSLSELIDISDSKITFGTDCNIYRSAADVLTTSNSLYVTGTLYGNKRQIYYKTADYTALTTESGGTFSNSGTGAIVTISLPAATAGLNYRLLRNSASYALRGDPNGTEIIRNGATVGGAGKYISLDTNGGNVSLECASTGVWEVVSAVGTVSFEA